MQSPIVDDVKDENPVHLDPEQISKYRSHVARCSFLSQDRADNIRRERALPKNNTRRGRDLPLSLSLSSGGVFTQAAEHARRAWTPTSQRVHTRHEQDVRGFQDVAASAGDAFFCCRRLGHCQDIVFRVPCPCRLCAGVFRIRFTCAPLMS